MEEEVNKYELCLVGSFLQRKILMSGLWNKDDECAMSRLWNNDGECAKIGDGH